ncbi:MAG: hypothetical protein ACLQU4_15030 [Limisphaerales bacterium]
MTPLNKTVRRVTLETYGYGRNARKLVVAFERGDLITIREQGRRAKHTARLVDVRWWMLRSQADKAMMEKLRQRKAKKAARMAARRQRAAERRLFSKK